jgi:outer membrane immunogenic protein
MTRVLLASVAAAALFSTASFAADLSVRRAAPPPAPMPYVAAPTWSGCYVGGNLGGAFGSASISGVAGTVSADNSGFAGGGQVGCDYQFAPGWVIGFRNMFDGTSNNRSGTLGSGPLAGDVVNFNNQWFDTLTGRIGYSWAQPWLVYFQGGAAWAHTSANITAAGVQIGQTSQTRTGWTVGGGVEWMFIPHWSAFLEGNYMDYGSTSGTAVTAAGTVCASPGCGFEAKATAANVLVGVNYRFW